MFHRDAAVFDLIFRRRFLRIDAVSRRGRADAYVGDVAEVDVDVGSRIPLDDDVSDGGGRRGRGALFLLPFVDYVADHFVGVKSVAKNLFQRIVRGRRRLTLLLLLVLFLLVLVMLKLLRTSLLLLLTVFVDVVGHEVGRYFGRFVVDESASAFLFLILVFRLFGRILFLLFFLFLFFLVTN